MSVIYGQTHISTGSTSFVTITTDINMVKYAFGTMCDKKVYNTAVLVQHGHLECAQWVV